MRAPRFLVPAAALGLVAVLGAACGPPGSAATPSDLVPDTVAGVGLLPPGSNSPVVDRPTSLPALPTTTLPPELQVGARAAGNRVLLIGDSLLASTSRRYADSMCRTLVPEGWNVLVEAETNRFVEFGREVLAVRKPADFDVVVVHLGTNFNGNLAYYRTELTKLVDALAGREVVLVTVTEFTPNRRDVNQVIGDVAGERPWVTVVDWAATTAAAPELLGPDGIHLTPEGRWALAEHVALALGAAPDGPLRPGCAESRFTDDSRGSVDGTTTTVARRPPTTTSLPGSTTTSTTAHSTTTTSEPGPPPTG